MKKIFSFTMGLILLNMANAQVKNPVQWDFSAKKINATIYEVYLTANMEDGWHVYSQHTPDGGPVPTSIQFAKNPLLTLNGTPKESGKKEQKFEELFGVDVIQFSDKVVFVQKVEVKGKAKTTLTGSVEFMTCNDRECLPPATQKFSIALK